MMELLKKDTTKPSDIQFLNEILDNIAMIETALKRSGDAYEVFVHNKEDIYIVKNAMQEIGELSKSISEPLKEKYGTSIDWDALKYTRDQLAHGYLSIIETKTLWRLAINERRENKSPWLSMLVVWVSSDRISHTSLISNTKALC